MATTAGTGAVIGRDVLYRFKFEVDNSVKQATEQVARTAEAGFERAERAKKKEAGEHKKALDEQVKQVEAYIKKVDEVGKLYETANNKRRAADMQLVASSKQAIEGVVQLGRAFVLLGVSSEKDLQKAVQALAGFEATAAAIKGTINVLEAASKAWGAYRAAVLAAGVANAGYAALSAGGGAVAAAGGGAAGQIATGAAGDIIGGTVVGAGRAVLAGKAATGGAAASLGASIGGVIATIVTSPVFIATGIALGVKALQEAATNRPGEGLVSGTVMRIPGYRSLAEGLGEGFFGTGSDLTATRARDFITRRQFENAQQQRQDVVDSLTSRAASSRFENALAFRSFAASQRAGGGTGGALAGVRAELGGLGLTGGPTGVALVERQVALRQRELDLVRQIGQEQKQAAQERIRGLQAELQTQEKIADQMRAQLTTAAERFGQLSPQEQQRTIAAQLKLQQGAQLSQEDRRRLRGLGLDSVTAGVQAQDIADANRAGFSRFFGGAERQQLAQAQREQIRLSVAIQREKNFVVQIESDTQREAQQLAQEVVRLMVERDAQLQKQLRDEIKRQLDQQTETRARDAQTAVALSGA